MIDIGIWYPDARHTYGITSVSTLLHSSLLGCVDIVCTDVDTTAGSDVDGETYITDDMYA
jgi:hypothetical protein